MELEPCHGRLQSRRPKGEAHEEEDVTITEALHSASQDEDEDMEPWTSNVCRCIERTRKPAKGILKSASFVSVTYLL